MLILFFTDIDPFIIVASFAICYIITSFWWIDSGIGDDGYAYQYYINCISTNIVNVNHYYPVYIIINVII